MKWILKLLFRLFVLLVVLGVILFLSFNSISRVFVEHQIRAQTGMDAEIGKISMGLLTPTVTVENFKLYNSPDFGGTPFLKISELHIEYDRAALARHEIHMILVRFNLDEFDIVKSEAGQTNIFSRGITLPSKQFRGTNLMANLKRQTGYDFKGIDVLNVSIGKVRFIDLKDPQNNREQTIGIENLLVKNVKSPVDLVGLAVYVVLKSNGFFDSLVDQKNPGPDILKLIGR